MSDLECILQEGAQRFQVLLSDRQVGMFMRFKELLQEWNRKINLTTIVGDQEIVIEHFLDSLACVPFLKPVQREMALLDVGTGGGVPGIPLKIVLPELDLVLLDASLKKVHFLEEVCRILGLQGARAMHGRAEDLGRQPEYRESFTWVVSRAVAPICTLAEYCLPFVKPGGFFIALKGPAVYDELEQGAYGIQLLGGHVEDIKKVCLPFSEKERHLVIVKKNNPTPHKYPRRAGMPKKKPLSSKGKCKS